MAEWKKAPLVQTENSWQDAPLAQAKNRWQSAPLVNEQASSLVTRFGKQLYNAFAQIPPGIIKTALRLSPGTEEKMARAEEEIRQKVAKGELPSEELARLERGKERGRRIGAALAPYGVKPAETWKETGVDIGAGVAGFAAQIALLRKAMPTQPVPVIWEMQNLMTGGKPGMGAAYGAVLGGAGKLGKTGLEKVGAEGLGLYVMGRITGAEPKEALTVAAVPAVLRGAGALKRRIIRPKAAPRVITKPTPNLKTKTVDVKSIRILPLSPELQVVNQQLTGWSKVTKKLRAEEVTAAIKALHRRQAARGTGLLRGALRKGEPAWVALRRVKRGFKGAAEVPDVTPPNVTPAQRELYARRILDIYPAKDASVTFSRENMVHSLDKFLAGKIPTNSEFLALDKLFGRETTLQLYNNLASKRPLHGLQILKYIIQVLKSPFAVDVQFARQASAFAVAEPRMYGRGVYRNIRAYLSEQYTRDLERALEQNPNHLDAAKYVKFLSRLPYATGRPEWYQFGLSEKLAKVGATRKLPARLATMPIRGIGRTLLAAERGFVTSTDGGLQELWDSQTKVWANQNLTPEQLIRDKTQYGNLVNAFMKVFKSKSPAGKKLQYAANYVLFSPGMTISRPAQIKHLLANKNYRGYAAELIATNIAKIAALSTLFSAAGNYWRARNPDKPAPIDGETNPLKGDWGKAIIGNTRFDFCGGDAQFYRSIARLAVGAAIEAKQQITGEPPAQEYIGKYRVQSPVQTFTDYLESRETAAIGFARSLATGKDFFGKDIGKVETIARGFTWEPIQATYDALAMDGSLTALLSGAAATFSAGVQTYPTAAYIERIEFQDKLARTKHGRKWEDLNDIEQMRLRTVNRVKFKEFEQKVQVERLERPKKVALEEQEKAGKWVLTQLSKEHRGLLKSAGLRPDVSRYAGRDWRLNNLRYKRYQRLIAQNLTQEINRLQRTPAWTLRRDNRLLERAIDMARKKARAAIRREAK